MDLISQIQAYEKTLCDIYSSTLRSISEAPQLSESNYNPKNYPSLDENNEQTPGAELEHKAEQLFTRVLDAEILIGALPAEFSSVEDQLVQIKTLIKENEILSNEMKHLQQDTIETNKQLNHYITNITQELYTKDDENE